MARNYVIAALAVVLVSSFAVSVSAGICSMTYQSGYVVPNSDKTCTQCQWDCLTNTLCASISFDGTVFPVEDLASYTCPDSTYTTTVGLCVLLGGTGADFAILDTQHQGCQECIHQCDTWEQCAGIVFNGQTVAKADLDTFTCDAPPVPIVPVAVPSPVPVVPSPVPVIPSPVPPPPSPVPPPPSPVFKPPTAGIVVRPGLCNYDIIRYDAPVITSFQVLSSDDCCAACKNSTTPCNVASFCFDSEDIGGCGANSDIPRYTCQLQAAEMGPDGFPSDVLPATAPAAKGWISVTVSAENTPDLFAASP